MIIFRIPIVIPQQWQWGGLFFVIGLFGYGAQVRTSLQRPSPLDSCVLLFKDHAGTRVTAGNRFKRNARYVHSGMRTETKNILDVLLKIVTNYQIIFAAILERIFFHVYPSTLSILGSAVIMTCAIYVAV